MYPFSNLFRDRMEGGKEEIFAPTFLPNFFVSQPHCEARKRLKHLSETHDMATPPSDAWGGGFSDPIGTWFDECHSERLISNTVEKNP